MLALNRFRNALLVTSAALAMGCSDDSTASQGGGGSPLVPIGGFGGSGEGGQGGVGGDTGGSGGEYVCPSPTDGVVLALTNLAFGEGNNGQWKSVGMNVDGLVSDGTSTDVCQPNAGGDPDVAYPDGNDGIDNSFGKNLLPLIINLAPGWPVTVNGYLDEGYFNTMLKLYCLPPTGNAPQLTTKLFGGTELGSTPLYNGTDQWPVSPEILGDPDDPESSTLVFDTSSVIGDEFDSGEPSTFILTVPIDFNDETTFLKLTLYSARITMTLADDRKSSTGGVIAGVLNTEEVVDQLKKVAFLAGYCDDDIYLAALATVRRASDIMSDGSQDPGSTCDAISFGVAFEMSEVQLGDVGPAIPPALSCP